MKKITIQGKFTGEVNNKVTVDVYRPNSTTNPYESKKTYYEDFEEVITDLKPGLLYYIDLSGFSYGTFNLSIKGDFEDPNPIVDSFTERQFNPGYVIQTKQ